VAEGWGNLHNQQKVVDGLNVLLRIWNQEFYGPYGFDEPALKQWLECNWSRIDGFRRRNIFSLSGHDHGAIALTFRELLPKLGKTADGKQKKVPYPSPKRSICSRRAFFLCGITSSRIVGSVGSQAYQMSRMSFSAHACASAPSD